MAVSTQGLFLSLGSNVGNREENLQIAVQAIFKRIGNIFQVSPVFQSKSWGFRSNDFLNCCVEVTTRLTEEEVLQICLEIEKDMGRTRSTEKGYQSRIIDIDLLFFDQKIVANENLQLPHPELQNRDFVLYPLVEIAPDFMHPVFGKTVRELFVQAAFQTEIKKTGFKLTNPKSQYPFNRFNYIAIEGNIGSGKTSLAMSISQEFGGKLMLERFADNPFLPKFYDDQHRYAFPLELSFLADRYQQFSDDVGQLSLFSDFMISDYDIYKSLIFSKITLAEDEFQLYQKFFNIIYKEAVKPDLYVYLYQNTNRLLENIRKRGRSYEQNIQPDYLEKIHQGYLDFIKFKDKSKVLIIDVSEIDFVNNRKDYLFVLDQISNYR
jgi:2-amino-4-hydroxy-6-hydroxymethyldihydropteridine diphosphokinase